VSGRDGKAPAGRSAPGRTAEGVRRPRHLRSIVHFSVPPAVRRSPPDAKYQFITQKRTIGVKSTWEAARPDKAGTKTARCVIRALKLGGYIRGGDVSVFWPPCAGAVFWGFGGQVTWALSTGIRQSRTEDQAAVRRRECSEAAASRRYRRWEWMMPTRLVNELPETEWSEWCLAVFA